MSTHHLLNFILIHPFHFLLALKEVLIPIVVLDLLIVNFRGQLSNFLVFSVELSLNGGLLVLLFDLNFVLEILDIGLELVSLLLLDQDLLRGLNLV